MYKIAELEPFGNVPSKFNEPTAEAAEASGSCVIARLGAHITQGPSRPHNP